MDHKEICSENVYWIKLAHDNIIRSFCEYGNKTLGCTKHGEYLDQKKEY
jgi:hypothetical protein